MGEPATRVSPERALDRFFLNYYMDDPVTATFTGIHTYDDRLPDWTANGFERRRAHTRVTRSLLQAALRDCQAEQGTSRPPTLRYPHEVDLVLADGFLEIQEAELDSPHFHRGNPSLWIGEAIFSVISLITRDFAPEIDRLESLRRRLMSIRGFVWQAQRTLIATPAPWKERAIREAEAAKLLVWGGLMRWIRRVSTNHALTTELLDECKIVGEAFGYFATWIAETLPTLHAPNDIDRSSPPLIQLLLRKGHWVDEHPSALLERAERELRAAERLLSARIKQAGCADWSDVQARLADQHPTREGYLARFFEVWERARAAAIEHDLVTWPDAPIRYVPIPEHTRDAAPNLYYLFYRSPAAFDRHAVHDYVVTPVDADLAPDEQERRLRAANDSVITLNHVIHHGGLGHHVQNWYAYRSPSRVGQIAAIDGASRIGMLCGGTLAEGWACYACDVMEEIGFLSPLERAAQQHTRVRLLCRAVVDLSLHMNRMSIEDGAAFYREHAMMSKAAAMGEAVKNSMFPATGVMYWLGTRGMHDLRDKIRQREGAAFSLKRFHDRVLSYGAIPVALISQLMLQDVGAGL